MLNRLPVVPQARFSIAQRISSDWWEYSLYLGKLQAKQQQAGWQARCLSAYARACKQAHSEGGALLLPLCYLHGARLKMLAGVTDLARATSSSHRSSDHDSSNDSGNRDTIMAVLEAAARHCFEPATAAKAAALMLELQSHSSVDMSAEVGTGTVALQGAQPDNMDTSTDSVVLTPKSTTTANAAAGGTGASAAGSGPADQAEAGAAGGHESALANGPQSRLPTASAGTDAAAVVHEPDEQGGVAAEGSVRAVEVQNLWTLLAEDALAALRFCNDNYFEPGQLHKARYMIARGLRAMGRWVDWFLATC